MHRESWEDELKRWQSSLNTNHEQLRSEILEKLPDLYLDDNPAGQTRRWNRSFPGTRWNLGRVIVIVVLFAMLVALLVGGWWYRDVL